MAGMIDTIYTYRFLKLLSTKWEDTDAYELGIVDEDGVPLRKRSDLDTTEEKKAYTPFVRLVFKLKRMMGKIPGGKSAVARYGAALALIKENSGEVESMGINLKSLEEGLKKYIDNDQESLEERFVNGIQSGLLPIGDRILKYFSKNDEGIEVIIKHAIGLGMNVKEGKKGVLIRGKSSSHKRLIELLQSFKIDGMVSEEVTNSTSGIEGKDQLLGKKGEINKRKKKKDDEVVNKEGSDEDTNEIHYRYQVIGGALIRVDEKKRVVKKRIVKGKRQKKREYKPTKRINKRGNKKLRGAEKTKWKRSHKKAYRKAHSSSASAKRRRSIKKSKKYNKK